MRSEEKSPVYKAMFNMFAQNDPHSFAVLKMLQDLYPAFGKKIFEGNPFMMKLVLSGMNPMDMLEYPVCGKCETLAAWTDSKRTKHGIVRYCGCMADKCGAITKNPITLKTWLKEELKKKAPPDIAEQAEIAVDRVAETMCRMAEKELVNAMNIANHFRNPKMGIEDRPIVLESGPEKPDIEVQVGNLADFDMNEIIRKEEEALKNDV